jgi:hypothetical protein
MERVLTKSELERWNGVLSNRNIAISVKNNGDSKPIEIISITPTDFNRNPYTSVNYISSNEMEYKIVFSIFNKKIDYFFELLNKFISIGFYGVKKEILNDILKSPEKKEHKIGKTEFTRYSYYFSGNILEVIAAVTIIEDAIYFLQEMYGVDEENNEVDIIPYQVGVIVSTVENKGIDYMVNDLFFTRPLGSKSVFGIDDRHFTKRGISYELVCIDLNQLKSSVVMYGESIVVTKDQIIPSRANNLNALLN